MTATLEAFDLLRRHEERVVLDLPAVSLVPGEILVVSGPNGAGKSTLLHILALLDHPDRGRVVYDGRELSGHGAWFDARRSITLVEQKPYAFPGTVERNVAYGLKLRKVGAAEARKRTAAALEKVGLADFINRPARGLSGGELRRMALARALVIEPAVLLLDEPTAHVDAAHSAEVETLIREAAAAGAAVALATHAGDQAERLADRSLRLLDGKEMSL